MIRKRECEESTMNEIEFEEKTIKRTDIFKGKILHVVVDDVKLPNGLEAQRELVFHNGAVAIVAITSDNKMVFVRQYRKALEKTIYEIPAGKIEVGEMNPLDVAKRELEEETGLQAQNWKNLYDFVVTPGFSNERVHLYEATDLVQVEHPLSQDEDEFLEIHFLTLEEAKEAIVNKKIDDAKTICAVQYWELKQKTKLDI